MSNSKDSETADEPIRGVDLFCGAGGLSWGLVEALIEVALNANEPTEAFLKRHIDLVGINHWRPAIETYQQAHPWARTFHEKIQSVDPHDVFEENNPQVKILSGGIECTHWSSARGGKPVSEQKRMPAFDALTWVQKLRPEYVLFENVPEFADWGPIDDDGQPTRTGETFDEWIDSLHALGYSVTWDTLNAANYGDATSRKRLFIMGSRSGSPTMPEPTHSDSDPDLPDTRPAADIIDWSDPGGSIWTRDLHDGRKKPLKNSTMQRIAEGIRRHCDEWLEPFADVLDTIGRDEVRRLRQNAIHIRHAETAARIFDKPFLVAAPNASTPNDETTKPLGLCVPQLLGQHSNSVARNVFERPAPTVTTDGNIQLASPAAYLLRQQSGGTPSDIGTSAPTIPAKGALQKVETHPLVMPRNGAHRGLHSNPLYEPDERPLHTVTAKNNDGYLVTTELLRYSHGGARLSIDEPLPTITTAKGGVFGTANVFANRFGSPYLCPLYNGRAGQRPRTRSVDRPLMTVPGSKSPAGLSNPKCVPFVDDYEGPAKSLSRPLSTITSKDRFGLVIPDYYPWGLDVRYRMLQPRELKAAQGFPDDYEITGNKTQTTRQIGNAVPVNLAQSLVESLLSETIPSLTDYVDQQPSPSPDINNPEKSGSPADD